MMQPAMALMPGQHSAGISRASEETLIHPLHVLKVQPPSHLVSSLLDHRLTGLDARPKLLDEVIDEWCCASKVQLISWDFQEFPF